MNSYFKWIWNNLDRVAMVVFTASLFFNIRKVFPQSFSYIDGQYSDFLTPTLHLVFLTTVFLLFSLYLKKVIKFKFIHFNALLIVSLIYLLQIILLPLNFTLSLYYFAFLSLGLIFYGSLQGLETTSRALFKDFAKTFIFFASLSSIVGIIQFSLGHSLGLRLLGESSLGNFYGVARQTIGDFIFLRGYGLTAHPNILGLLLSIGLILNLWLKSFENKRIYKFSLLLLVLGLICTFSLSSALASILGLLSFFLLNKGDFILNKKFYSAILLILVIFSLLMFHVKLTETENPYILRQNDNNYAIDSLLQRPFLGLGFGQSMLHMEQSNESLNSWEIQPFHNFSLEVGAEAGIGVVFLIIGLFLWHFWISYKIRSISFVLLMIVGFLSFFDHYFYTSAPAVFLFWFVLGITPLFPGKHPEKA